MNKDTSKNSLTSPAKRITLKKPSASAMADKIKSGMRTSISKKLAGNGSPRKEFKGPSSG